MRSYKYFFKLGVVFILVLSTAIFLDSRRILDSKKSNLAELENEIVKLEERYVRLADLPFDYFKSPTEIREIEFDKFVGKVSNRVLASDSELTRRLNDDLNGALNRRQLLLREFSSTTEEFRSFEESWLGSLGRVL